jgi:hypothetical protein
LTGYLVDTNVLSARKDAALVSWLDAASRHLWLSAVTAAEVQSGIARKRREHAFRQVEDLSAWWAMIVHLYGPRILPFDLGAATIAGELMDRARSRGETPGFADIAIAATASRHDLVVLTRNVRHFAPLGVAFMNPYDELPPIPV